MVYKVLEDRPASCDGCNSADYPGQFGPSAKQITWNGILNLWLCVDCRVAWSAWVSTDWQTDAIRKAKTPAFIIMLEKEREGYKAG